MALEIQTRCTHTYTSVKMIAGNCCNSPKRVYMNKRCQALDQRNGGHLSPP
ncbi:uncharacterized protein DS421_19g675080 [Arachis hypogaea]|uniref:Uncharacterized protein n=1 Tax=Arachis hypogaea TaxID=3818 RepID=A0A6B9VI48_ARAHY|nr:uncharacterized protein DS421_19g675080 [Arachis hypogaea]